LNDLAQKLSNFSAISFLHTKREGNKVADLLANIGTETYHSLLSGDTNIISNRQQLQECQSLILAEAIAPDAGVIEMDKAVPHDEHGLPRENARAFNASSRRNTGTGEASGHP